MKINKANFIDKWIKNNIYGTNYYENNFIENTTIKVKEKYLYYYSNEEVKNIIDYWKLNNTISII